jgi:uncharacterized protein
MSQTLEYMLLFGAGAVAGVVNVIAGGGSFLTLPVLIFLGLPPTVANGTNRVAILCQNVGAVWSFHRRATLAWDSLVWAALPATAGSFLGVWLALNVSDALFQRMLAIFMVILALWVFWDPHRGAASSGGRPTLGSLRRILLVVAFLLVGVYGGFVQAGVGFLVLAATTEAGYDLVRGNAIKVLCILVFTTLSLGGFVLEGRVEWIPGLWLGAGSLLGGLLGVHWTVARGHAWVKRFVTVTILVFAVLLWVSG